MDDDGRVLPAEIHLSPGPVRLVVHYGYPKFSRIGAHALAPAKKRVSATCITSQQDFWDLFAAAGAKSA